MLHSTKDIQRNKKGLRTILATLTYLFFSMSQTAKSVCRLYRNILKGMKTYPSSKREKLIAAIKEEFHDHAKETDPKKIDMYIRDAEAGLKQIQQYSQNDHRGTLSYTLGE